MKTAIITILFVLIVPIQSLAKPIEFIKEYTYDAGETDSLLSCRTISLMEVKRLLLEELGTYLVSNTEIENYQLKKDQITVLTGGIVKTDIVNEKWNGQTYWIQASIKSDPEDVLKTIDELKRSNELDDKIEKLKEEYRNAYDQIDELKDRLAEAQRNLFELNKDYEKAQSIVSATKLLEIGIQQRMENKTTEALNSFDSGIDMNPSYILYIERGRTYINIEQFNKAIDDFNNAIKMRPGYGKAYYYKGIALIKKGNKRKGVKIVKKAAELGNHTAKLWLKSKNIPY